MKDQDLAIGIKIFGWTAEPTEENTYFDTFFEIWRPKPKNHKDLYPSWSMSREYAGQLIEHLAAQGASICLQSDVGYLSVQIELGEMHGSGCGDTLPQALADAVINLEPLASVDLRSLSLITQGV